MREPLSLHDALPNELGVRAMRSTGQVIFPGSTVGGGLPE